MQIVACHWARLAHDTYLVLLSSKHHGDNMLVPTSSLGSKVQPLDEDYIEGATLLAASVSTVVIVLEF